MYNIKGNVIAIMSPKGGAGKTVTTANLAVALSTEFNKKVLAIDTNITTASLGFHLNLFYPKVTMYDVLRKNFYLGKAIYKFNKNLDIIPASIKIEKGDKNINIMQSNLKRIVDYFDILLSQIVNKYDIVLLDSAPGFSAEAMATMQVADGILFVTNPEYPAIAATAKAVEYAKLLGIPMGGIILNKVLNKRYELTEEQIEKALNAKVIQKIPMDNKIPESIANKTPVVLSSPHTKSSIAYKELAGNIFGEEYRLKVLDRLNLMFDIF